VHVSVGSVKAACVLRAHHNCGVSRERLGLGYCHATVCGGYNEIDDDAVMLIADSDSI